MSTFKTVWKYRDQFIGVIAFIDDSGVNPTKYSAWIQWSDKLALRHEHQFDTRREAEQLKNAVITRRLVNTDHWGRIGGVHMAAGLHDHHYNTTKTTTDDSFSPAEAEFMQEAWNEQVDNMLDAPWVCQCPGYGGECTCTH